MEDFDYIDALAKSELSSREVTPSENGWDIVQQKLKRKRKKRRTFFLLLFFVGIGSVGIYQVMNFNTVDNDSTITHKNTKQPKIEDKRNTITISDSSSISDIDNISQTEKNTLQSSDKTHNNNQEVNTLQGSEKRIVHAESKMNSRKYNTKDNPIYNNDAKISQNSIIEENEILQDNKEDKFSLEAQGAQLYNWKLISPETLKKKRKKRKSKKKTKKFYENTDIMVGLNSFFSPNDYQVLKSYVVEFSYEIKKDLKKNYVLNYGAGLQLRNLRFKNDSAQFNRGELSFNLFSNIEKRFGDYSVEAGVYVGYEIYSPNNEFFNSKVKSFFDQKINYGVSTGINYKNIGLIFKYELSPYINYLGDKKYGGFIIGVKYDF